jgi:hypothetical protein
MRVGSTISSNFGSPGGQDFAGMINVNKRLDLLRNSVPYSNYQ